mmetsp:Transcript_10805/g.19896  ORF Transcript_10805/g.19896 Transcript_10805/m.19896 type:complete len:81 (+) Transcript_10805:774-1016(+)
MVRGEVNGKKTRALALQKAPETVFDLDDARSAALPRLFARKVHVLRALLFYRFIADFGTDNYMMRPTLSHMDIFGHKTTF